MSAKLRMLDKAYDEVLKLPRAVKGAIYDFQHKFRENPNSPGLQFKQLQGTTLFSARVNLDYRALLLHAGGSEYVIVAVKPRQEVYDNLDKYAHQINPVTGGIEFVDLVTAESAVATEHVGSAGPVPLFAQYSEQTLMELGVAEPLLPLIAKITSEDELEALISYTPQLTSEVLLELFSGKTPAEVLEQITAPVKASDAVDTGDYRAALARPATVTTEDGALHAILEEGDFGRWKVFLHPAQRAIVERNYNGPARVSGGPGTGKTIVALHRVKQLADRLEPGGGKDILLTTFNTNLAADLRQRLIDLAGPEILSRVDIFNIDKLAFKVANGSGVDSRTRINDAKAVEEWRLLLAEQSERQWDPQFLHDEWTQVILGQGLTTRAEYFKARRAGRGQRISRDMRAAIWNLTERFVKRLDDQQVWTFRQVAERAATLAGSPGGQVDRYRHVVVDEAQDLSPTHWRLLRQLVPESPNDLFIAGDPHQRIYGQYASLGQLGINIRGRSAKLTLSYRTTHEILSVAAGLLGEEEWDDLDEGQDDLVGYRSVLRGQTPEPRPYLTWEAELDGTLDQINEWGGRSIGVAVPERWMTTAVAKRLSQSGITATVIGSDGPRDIDAAVHVGTMHRFKGLEYQRMILAGVADGLLPSSHALALRQQDPARYRVEIKQARSLLFVAATRARDSLVISWNGKKSRFLP
ncbi:UvrD-helicase domain-containing protein [Nocardia sp. BMG51109]|uniref:UvrD-helicase domain-containing protein n=1 Tax=Nocardia sp. BMG51109 TaxID=1056816 RepID=UPI0004663149|nr:UvrD-helicase domain-containing protein [Nocardia sp. BMG51109]